MLSSEPWPAAAELAEGRGVASSPRGAGGGGDGGGRAWLEYRRAPHQPPPALRVEDESSRVRLDYSGTGPGQSRRLETQPARAATAASASSPSARIVSMTPPPAPSASTER